MDEALTLSGTAARARKYKAFYQALLGCAMILSVCVGIGCIFLPHRVCHIVKLPPLFGWVRAWGALLILVTALYIPGLQDRSARATPTLPELSAGSGWRSHGSASVAGWCGSACSMSPWASPWDGYSTSMERRS